MGMFDSIQCNYPLPLPLEVVDLPIDIYDVEFQTKDFDNTLSHYFIEESGRITEERVQREWVDDDSSFLKGYLKTISKEIVNTNYHGTLEFYCYEDVDVDNKVFTLDLTYLAKFTDGNLVSLEILEYSVKDNTLYKQECKLKMEELLKKRNNFFNKYFFTTRPILFVRRKIVYKFFNGFYNLASFLRSFVHRYL